MSAAVRKTDLVIFARDKILLRANRRRVKSALVTKLKQPIYRPYLYLRKLDRGLVGIKAQIFFELCIVHADEISLH